MTRPQRPKATGALNTLRHTLSEAQWESALQAAKSQWGSDPSKQDQRDPDQPRHRAIRRCLLRIDRGEASPGLYLVRSSDISAGGIRIIHGGPAKPQTVCAVIIESTQDQSTLAGGLIAWCTPVKGTDPPAYEIGIRFHQLIDTAPFVPQQDETDAAWQAG